MDEERCCRFINDSLLIQIIGQRVTYNLDDSHHSSLIYFLIAFNSLKVNQDNSCLKFTAFGMHNARAEVPCLVGRSKHKRGATYTNTPHVISTIVAKPSYTGM